MTNDTGSTQRDGKRTVVKAVGFVLKVALIGGGLAFLCFAGLIAWWLVSCSGDGAAAHCRIG